MILDKINVAGLPFDPERLYLELKREFVSKELSLEAYYLGGYYVGLTDGSYRLLSYAACSKEKEFAWLEGHSHGQADRKLYGG